MKIEYITSNRQKFVEAQHILSDWELERVDLDLTEIQGSPEEIIKAKALEAMHILKRPLVVDDISLCCPAIGGLPGPYVKDFLKKIGGKGIAELILKYSDHSVTGICHIAYALPGEEPVIFKGVVEGTIVLPRGEKKHESLSWNPIVQPIGYPKTFGEMTMDELSRLSMRAKALTKLKHYLERHPV